MAAALRSCSTCHQAFQPRDSRQRFCRSTCRDRKLGRERRIRRGTTVQRGYDAVYRRARDRIKPDADAGLCDCWRCGHRILPGTPWHLGHDDHDRTIIRGPEHAHCNLSAAARHGNAQRVTAATYSSTPRVVP